MGCPTPTVCRVSCRISNVSGSFVGSFGVVIRVVPSATTSSRMKAARGRFWLFFFALAWRGMDLQTFEPQSADVFRVAEEADQVRIYCEAAYLDHGRGVVVTFEPENQVLACGVDVREEGYLQAAQRDFAVIALLDCGDEVAPGYGLEPGYEESCDGGEDNNEAPRNVEREPKPSTSSTPRRTHNLTIARLRKK